MYFRNSKKYSKNISLNEQIGFDKDGNEITFLDILKTPKPDYAMDIHNKNNILHLKKYFDILNKREKEIIVKRFGLGCVPMTLEAIGNQLGISKERVRQRQNAALRKLRNPCRSNLLKDCFI